jgi:hypothetical protein
MLTVVPPKQKPTAPILPLTSGRLFTYSTAAARSSVRFAASSCWNICAAFSSLPGYPPSGVSASGANAT